MNCQTKSFLIRLKSQTQPIKIAWKEMRAEKTERVGT